MELEDLRRILALLADYGRTLDGGLWEEHLGLYADECRLDVFGREHVGKEEIRRFMQKAPRGKHLTGVPRIVLEGASARAFSDFLFFGANLQLASAGGYADELARVNGEWLFVVRKIRIDLRA